MSYKSVTQECQIRVSSKSVLPEPCAIVSSKGVLQECHLSVSPQGVSQVGSLENVRNKYCLCSSTYVSAFGFVGFILLRKLSHHCVQDSSGRRSISFGDFGDKFCAGPMELPFMCLGIFLLLLFVF